MRTAYVDATTLTTEEELQDAVAQYSVFGRVTRTAEESNGAGTAVTGSYSCHDR